MSALPEIAVNSTGVDGHEAAPVTTSDRDVTGAIALLLEGLLTESEFMALTGIDAQSVPQRLADTAALVEVQRMALEMRNSGKLARLEAARHARAAVEVAAQIMTDTDMHPSHRISAATLIARAAGTEKPPAEDQRTSETFRINIIMGSGTNEQQVTTIEARPIRQPDTYE